MSYDSLSPLSLKRGVLRPPAFSRRTRGTPIQEPHTVAEIILQI